MISRVTPALQEGPAFRPADRLENCLSSVAFPAVQAALSTILCVCSLLFVNLYMTQRNHRCHQLTWQGTTPLMQKEQRKRKVPTLKLQLDYALCHISEDTRY
ncbi:hypothetical protein RB195_007006 [Necator americanus]|uniref:Uncharacterized protein n=1 Tax=Necator americanus TaxID=51031 RepID=A0ABR1BWK1_NECAM